MNAQLVPNPGFEAHTSCPSSFGQFNLVTDWRNPSTGTAGCIATPDYFNSCSPPGMVGVPLHTCGTLADHSTGQAYAGLVSLEQERTAGVWNVIWAEYIQCKLSSPLEIGKTYRLQYFVSFNTGAELTSDMGYIVSTTPIDQICSQSITRPLPADLTMRFGTSPTILADNLWHPVVLDFVATACNMEYLTIGRFPILPNDPATNIFSPTCTALSGLPSFRQAYCYIDDVSLTDITPNNIGFSPNNTFICLSTTPTFTRTLTPLIAGTFSRYEWYKDGVLISGATGTTYTTSEPGVYEIRGYIGAVSPCQAFVSATYTINTSGSAFILDYLPTLCNTAQTMSVSFRPFISPTPTVTWAATNATNPTGTGLSYTPNFINDAIQSSVTLTINYGNGCTHQETFQIYPCCRLPNMPPINANVDATFLLDNFDINNNGILGQYEIGEAFFNEYFDGILTINENLTLDGVRFNMMPFSRIVVMPGATLTLKNAELFASCPLMWRGILLKDNTARVIISNNCIIEDALEGINSTNGGVYDVRNTIFNRCLVGIKVNRYALPHTGSVQSTQFLSEATHIFRTVPTTLFAPNLGERGRLGIEVDRANDITIGNIGGIATRNTFSNLRNGIFANMSGVNIRNNQFTNIIDGPIPTVIGTAIHVRGDNTAVARALPVTIGSIITTDANFINGCTYGIKVSRIGSTVIGNTLNNCWHAIRIDTINSCPFAFLPFTTNVTLNNISNMTVANSFGIQALENFNSTRQIAYNTISNATFTGAATSSAAIQIVNSLYSSSTLDNLTINNNTIANMKRGIYTLNIGLNNIYSNAITSSAASTLGRAGIWVEAGQSNRIDCNDISLGGIGTGNKDIGIYVKNSILNRIRKNKTNNSYFGIQFFGNCKTDNNLWGNKLNTHFKYISITNGGVFGIQNVASIGTGILPLPGNEFLNATGRDRMWSQNSSDGTLSPYRYKDTGYPSYVPLPVNRDALSSSFITITPRTSPNPYTWSGACGAPLPRLADTTEVDTTLSNEAQKIAYAPIDEENQSLEETTEKYQAKGDIYEQLKLDSIVVEWTDSLDLFKAEYATSEAYELKDIKEELLNGELENAKYKLLQVAPSVYAEEQLKLVLEWQTDTIVPDTGTAKFAALEAIAYQCPNEGGEAVYIARAVLMAQYGFIEFDDEALCAENTEHSSFRRANPIIEKNSDIEIIETIDNITIQSKSDKEIQSIEIYDMNGKIVNAKVINNNIDISILSSGLYIIKISYTDYTETTKYYLKK